MLTWRVLRSRMSPIYVPKSYGSSPSNLKFEMVELMGNTCITFVLGMHHIPMFTFLYSAIFVLMGDGK